MGIGYILARLDADQVVPDAGHVPRAGPHGVRRRCPHCRTESVIIDEAFHHGRHTRGGCSKKLRHHGRESIQVPCDRPSSAPVFTPRMKPAGWNGGSLQSIRENGGCRQRVGRLAWRTPQFRLLRGGALHETSEGDRLCWEGIAHMIRQRFPGRVLAAAAAGFVGLISLFNMVGRYFFWAKNLRLPRVGAITYMVVLHARHPSLSSSKFALGSTRFRRGLLHHPLDVRRGFATIPAYCGDMFGTYPWATFTGAC